MHPPQSPYSLKSTVAVGLCNNLNDLHFHTYTDDGQWTVDVMISIIIIQECFLVERLSKYFLKTGIRYVTEVNGKLICLVKRGEINEIEICSIELPSTNATSMSVSWMAGYAKILGVYRTLKIKSKWWFLGNLYRKMNKMNESRKMGGGVNEHLTNDWSYNLIISPISLNKTAIIYLLYTFSNIESLRTEQRANGEVLQNRIEVLEAEMASVKQSLQKKQQRQEWAKVAYRRVYLYRFLGLFYY